MTAVNSPSDVSDKTDLSDESVLRLEIMELKTRMKLMEETFETMKKETEKSIRRLQKLILDQDLPE